MLFICYLKEETALKCPFCNYNDTKVIDSRGQEDNSVIRRRRLCESCGKRFTTYERIDMIPITVIKNDGTREIFDKTKIINGVMKSCNKRPVTAQQIQELADDIENTLMGLGEREVESKQIGNMVMDRLKEVDEVAYVRFASVYRQFKDINTFIDELEKLLGKEEGMILWQRCRQRRFSPVQRQAMMPHYPSWSFIAETGCRHFSTALRKKQIWFLWGK